MEEVTIAGFIAIFEEMFGFWLFWFLVIMAVVGIGLFFYFLIKEKRTKLKNFLWAMWAAPFAGVASIFIILWMTHSWFDDIGGAIDVFILMFVAIFSAIAVTVLTYIGQAFWDKKSNGSLT